MSFKNEIDRNKQIIRQVETIKEKIKTLADKTSTEIELGVDTPETLMDKIGENLTTVSMVLKENGAYTLTITKG